MRWPQSYRPCASRRAAGWAHDATASPVRAGAFSQPTAREMLEATSFRCDGLKCKSDALRADPSAGRKTRPPRPSGRARFPSRRLVRCSEHQSKLGAPLGAREIEATAPAAGNRQHDRQTQAGATAVTLGREEAIVDAPLIGRADT